MRLLLDTHAVLWAVGDPSKLSTDASELVRDPTHELAVSAVVPWELSIKHHLGKLEQARGVLLSWTATLERLGATPMPITHAHALAAGALTWAHRDPFDRMLATQAMSENLALVSTDTIFDTLPGLTRMW
ncbi:MAG: type II toxin-antitoxin system VapC family toxin [Micrococcales bacterium]|nr:type II toxin-antitoxin system VapC family toxin [Micrococcales bacterium]